jgi:hypothetical protein
MITDLILCVPLWVVRLTSHARECQGMGIYHILRVQTVILQRTEGNITTLAGWFNPMPGDKLMKVVSAYLVDPYLW